MNVTIFNCKTFQCFRPKKKRNEEGGENSASTSSRGKIDTADIVYAIPDSEAEYHSIYPINLVNNYITDIQIYSSKLHVIHIDGEFVKQFKISKKELKGKLSKHILPADHQRQLEDNLKSVETSKKHMQKSYIYGKFYIVHDYFPLIDKLDNMIALLIFIRKIDN
jgi:hypothetical protein